MSKIELYLENGEKASLEDVCKWWVKTYPPDVFVNKPEPVVEARMCMQNILVMMHKQEVNRCSPLDDKQKGGNGIPPTNKLVGILPLIIFQSLIEIMEKRGWKNGTD